MKKSILYILGFVLLTGVVLLLFTGNDTKEQKFDSRLTLKNSDKIPYGTWVAYHNLHHIFPDARISSENNPPGHWDSLYFSESSQVLMIITNRFNADEDEMRKLIGFIENGNDVFLSATSIGYYPEKFFKCDTYAPAFDLGDGTDGSDSLTVSLSDPYVNKTMSYSYPGRTDAYWFYALDTLTTTVLGYASNGKPNFIRLKAGKGNFFVHLTPLAFTNYFLLHKNNISYYEKAMSMMSSDVHHVVWDEYFAQKKAAPDKKRNNGWLSVLINLENPAGKKSFGAAFWLLLAGLLLYVLMEMRRKQRAIPVIKKPGNDSLDFVKTIGRLYHEKGDHHNLAKKMAAYFLEHVRSRYKLATSKLDDEFVVNLQHKTGVEHNELYPIVHFIIMLNSTNSITDKQLIAFYRQLESFYKKA